MAGFGYTVMTEQSGPRQLVDYAVAAEQVGFDFEVCSDHYSPWLDSQGHAPNAWPVLGAVAHATDSVRLYSYVTCPTIRYHPAIVAQQAATVQILADGRFTLGVGSGENLNEHVVGRGWPTIERRLDMLAEAIKLIRELLTGELIDFRGEFYEVDSARVWDVHEEPVAIGVSMTGPKAVEKLAVAADHLINIAPDRAIVDDWQHHRRAAGVLPEGRVIGQVPVCWDPDREAAVDRAYDQFRWAGGGWAVNADLPTPAGFAAATRYVRREDVAAAIPCGPDLDAIVAAAAPYREAGFTDIALLQIGDQGQQRFLDEAAKPLLAVLRAELD